MYYRLRDAPALLATSAGRRQIAEGLSYRLWPLTSRMARLYRRTVIRRTRVVAVVGSFGKSTTLRAVSAALGIPRTDATLSNAWGYVSRAILNIPRARTHAVIEVGIGDKGHMRPYASVVRPDITVVTSIGSEHHRSLGALDVTRDEKAWMVRALPSHGIAVLNGDDPNVMWMRGETRARVVTYGFGAACDVRAEDVRFDWPRGMRFRLVASGQVREVAIRFVGRHMIYPALAAAAVAQIEDVPLDGALSRVAELEPTPQRMQPVTVPGGVTILCDEYKSTTETIDAALDAFAEIPARRRIVFLGEISEPVGPQRQAYQRLGERVARIASHFFIIGGSNDAFRSGARRGGMPADRIVDAGRSPQEAAKALAAVLEPGDVVLLKGRDTQRLNRVALILMGRVVRCDLRFCNLRTVACDRCAMLEPGWGARRAVM